MDKDKLNLNNQKKSGHLGYIVFLLGLIAITFHVLLKDISIRGLFSIMKSLNPTMCILGLLSAFGFICCEAWVFKTLLSLLSNKLSFFQTIKYSIVGFYFSSITPSASGGQPMQIYYMNKDDINISHSSLTILITMVIYQITMVSYALVAFLMDFRFVAEVVQSIYPFIIFGFAANLLVVSFVIMAIFSDKLVFKVVRFIVKLLYKLKFIKDMEKAKEYTNHQIDEYKQGALLIRKNPKVILKVFITTFLQLTAMFSVTFFVYRAFGLNELSFWRIVGLQSIAHIAVCALPLPGAVGASEGTFMVLFKSLFPTNLLSSAMLVSRGISYYIMVLISGLFVISTHIKSTKRNSYTH